MSSQFKDNTRFTDFFRGQILNWYDKHARVLPWRAPFGHQPDPYHVWLSEIMLQQTTVATVKAYFEKFISIWPTVIDLAKAEREDVLKEWAGLGYYARARNLHKCAQMIMESYEGEFPKEEQELLNLPGIGPYTAAAISSIAFDQPAAVMDGNIERVMARIFAVTTPLPKSKPELKSYIEELSKNRLDRPGDFAQSLMDLGSSICTPTSPKCMICPLNNLCRGYEEGIAADLPKKIKKSPKPQRFGYVYWIENKDNQIFLVQRPDKGLLGGMLALPSTEWREDLTDPHLIEAAETKHFVTHVFTHFKLKLMIKVASSPEGLDGNWVDKSEVSGLPTVFKKVYKLMV